MKVAIVSKLLPPSPSGQAMMLDRLLRDTAPDQYCLITALDEAEFASQGNFSKRLPARYFHLSTRHEVTRGHRFGLRAARELINVSAGSYLRARQIAGIVKAEKCEAVLCCSSGEDLLDMPSAFIASRLTRTKFFVYLFDTYSHMWLEPGTRVVGRALEPFMLKRAAGVIATNEMVRDLLRDRYQVAAKVIHNPCDLSLYSSHPVDRPSGVEVRIVYTGTVFAAHEGALRNLVAAIELLRMPEVKLHLYTATPETILATRGIKGPVVLHGYLPVADMPAVQRQADVLFLPFAFDSPYPELIKVSSPSKIGEFLASRRPVLVHAPPDSFVSTYFRTHDCGVVVDEDDPSPLASALRHLLADERLRDRITANAWERAVSDFSLEEAKSRFAEFLGLRTQEAK